MVLRIEGVDTVSNRPVVVPKEDPLGRMLQPQPNGGILPCPDTCDPVIGADGKVYRNECEAKRAGTEAIANAVDRSICGQELDLVGLIKDNIVWVIAALALAFVLTRR